MMKLFFLCIILIVLTCISCAHVKEYEKYYINDRDMILNAKNSEKYELNFQLYREGGAGANGGKSGGGCGCN